MRRLAALVGVAALLGSGGYLFVYIYRWEWHRALLVGVLFLGTLVVLSTALVLRRVASVEQQVAARAADSRSAAAGEQQVLDRLRAAPVPTQPFPWLQPGALERTSIFIPVLLGSGMVLSGLAWLVERVAGRSARAGVEQELARELAAISFPRVPLVPGEVEALACDDGFAEQPGLRLLLGPGARGPGA